MQVSEAAFLDSSGLPAFGFSATLNQLFEKGSYLERPLQRRPIAREALSIDR